MGAGNVSIQDKYRIPVAAVNSQIGSGNICRPSCVNFDEVFRMATKKSLYEILEVPPHATYADIQASHQRLLQALEDKRDLLSREDYTLQMRLLKVAYSTLCTPTSRDAYDAHLTTRSDPVKSPSALLVTTPDATIRAQELRADAMLLRPRLCRYAQTRSDSRRILLAGMWVLKQILPPRPLPSVWARMRKLHF
jgi:hypothetical protein